MMRKIVSYTFLGLGLTLLFSTCVVSGYGAKVSPELPKWQVGNWWKFNIEISGEANLVGTYTYKVVNDDVDILQNEQNLNCYQIDTSGEGTLSSEVDGNEIEGTWTITEQQYYMKSDQSWVAIKSTLQETFSVKNDSGATRISLVQDEKITSTTTIETTYNPPFEANKAYPLTVGESWSASTNETTTTQTVINWNLEYTTETKSYTKTFLVLRKESTTLPIGETETYVVKRTDPDGAYAESYYSPEAGFDIKQIEYNSTGTVQVTLELLDYFYPTVEDNPQLLTTETLQILTIPIIIAIIIIAVILLLKRKRTKYQSQTNDVSFLDSSLLPNKHKRFNECFLYSTRENSFLSYFSLHCWKHCKKS
jgi:hypothetical protein